MEDMRHRKKEALKLLLLNMKTKLIGESELSLGTINTTLVSPREVLQKLSAGTLRLSSFCTIIPAAIRLRAGRMFLPHGVS